MLGKVKKWLGIEGVKLELVVEETFDPKNAAVSGRIRLSSKEAQTVAAIKIVLIERYARGRDPERRIDEYLLGELVLDKAIEVPANEEPIEVPFLLPFSRQNSPVDEFGDQNLLFGGLAWVARKTRNVTSQYRLEAEADVKGVGLNPFDKVVLG